MNPQQLRNEGVMNIEWVCEPEGYKAMNGPHLVCRVVTNQQFEERVTQEAPGASTGFHLNSLVRWKALPKEAWLIHWAAACFPLALAVAVAQSLPTVASADVPQ